MPAILSLITLFGKFMHQKSISQAILLLVLANLLASLSDVSLKILNGEVPTFQYVFIRQFISLFFILPFWLKLPKTQYREGCCKINFIRAQFLVGGSACAMIAITHLTLATTTADSTLTLNSNRTGASILL